MLVIISINIINIISVVIIINNDNNNDDDNDNNNNDNNKVGEILNKRADFGIGAVKVQALIVNTLSASY